MPSKHLPILLAVICVMATVFLGAANTKAAPTGLIRATKTLYAFQRPPNYVNSLVVAGDGNMYGASSSQGYLVRVTPAGAFSVIHNFLGDSADTPIALTLGKDGNLYGILSSNGSIFKSDLAGNVTILATVGSAAQPFAVIQAADGNLYGTASAIGSASQGWVFKITPAGQLTIIHDFAGGSAGFQPTELIETTPGVFYGLCRTSSSASRSIFRLTAEGAFSIAHDFAGSADSGTANLVFAGDGNVYGLYSHSPFLGTAIFRLTPAGELSPIGFISGIVDMALGGDGKLYVATSGSLNNSQENRTIRRVTLSGEVTLLYTFTGQDDGADLRFIAAGPNNDLFGVTRPGSIADAGTIYRLDSAGQFTTLVKLGTVGEGYSPGAFFQANDGSFYGATALGGSGGYGTIYHIAPSGERTTLHEFAGDTGAPQRLVLGQDGYLYGATSGIDGNDTLFRLETSGAFTVLHHFSGSDGSQVTGLAASQDGNIYGIANGGYGRFFRITPTGAFSIVRVFDQNLGSPISLVETKDGKLYGLGSVSYPQMLFQIATDGATTIVHSFSGDPIGGAVGAFVAGADGNLYGTMGGNLDHSFGRTRVVANGGLWRCSPTGTFVILHTFDNADGLFYPVELVPSPNGDLYGFVSTWVLYRFTAGGVFEPLYKLEERFDQIPGGLTEGKDGNLYGATGLGGPFGGGMLFRFVFGNPSAVNLSTRMKVGAGDNVSIGGFIITGNAAKKVMLRGIGPSLAVGGQPLSGRLDDPMLELHDGTGAVIGKNDNWRTTQIGGVITSDQSSDILASTIAPTNDRESAIIATLQPGNYTAIVSGSQNTTGIGLVEIYDLAVEANAQLANISTRGFVDTGDNVLIGGFIVDGSPYTHSNIVVRAIGPSLSQNGISNLLQDPSLLVFDQNGGQLGANDDWRDGNQPEIVSFGLTPKDDRESALYLSLPAGNYTAVVSGKGGATGVALVETYNVQ